MKIYVLKLQILDWQNCLTLKDSALSMAEVRGTIGFIAPEVFSRVLESCPLNRMFTATG